MVLYKTISFNLLVIYLVYSVPRFCFHVLHNISIIRDTFAPKLNPFIGMKIAQIFSFETSVLIQNQKLECLRGFCIAKDMNVPGLITLKNCPRCPEYFGMEKRRKHLPYWFSVRCLVFVFVCTCEILREQTDDVSTNLSILIALHC